jgi:UDP-N-acetylmuramate--alanine ligase
MSNDINVLPDLPARIHIVGIGGIGLSGLAQMLHTLGYQISGSDATANDRTAALSALGIPVSIGHTDLEHAANADVVVSTRAVLLANTAEIRAAIEAGRPVVKRGEVLAMLANARREIAVAGSHGKSTTCGMLVVALTALGTDPSYAVGAVVGATGTNAAVGSGDVMVVEADEFDLAFLWLSPEIAIVTNIEFDHPDIFPDQLAYDDAFAQFAAKLRLGGTLIVSADDPGCARLVANASRNVQGQIVTYGEWEGADWRLFLDESIGWQVRTPDGTDVQLALSVPGRHNALNATACVAALATLGHDPQNVATALSTFTGVGRRFEIKGEVNGVLVVDDYAHHPTEIRATIRAVRERYPTRWLWAVFQPHTYSRTKALLADFALAFDDAGEVIILDIYPARETDTLGISSDDLRALVPVVKCHAASQPADAVDFLVQRVAEGDIVLTLGAGDVTTIGPALLQRLRDRSDQ